MPKVRFREKLPNLNKFYLGQLLYCQRGDSNKYKCGFICFVWHLTFLEIFIYSAICKNVYFIPLIPNFKLVQNTFTHLTLRFLNSIFWNSAKRKQWYHIFVHITVLYLFQLHYIFFVYLQLMLHTFGKNLDELFYFIFNTY